MPSIHRRALLGTIATGTVVGLAGCSSSCPDGEPPEPSTVVRSDGGASGFETLPNGAWPSPRFDAANTGYAPSASLPTDSLALRWRTTVPAPSVEDAVASASSPTVADGQVYLATGDGVFALSLRDGTERWHSPDVQPARTAANAGEGGGVATPVVGDGLVYLAATDALVALEEDDGTVAWRYDDATPESVPALAGDALFVPVTDGVVSLDANDGTRRWGVDGLTGAQPAVADGTVVVAGERIVALGATAGDRRWEAEVRTESPPVVADGTVFLGESDGIVGLYTGDGTRRFTVDRGGGRRFSAPVVAPDTVYAVERPVEAADATFALDRRDGGAPEPRWCSHAGEGVVAAATGDHAVALHTGATGDAAPTRLVAFTARFGEATWGYAAATEPVATALLDGGVVVTTRRGTVAALGGA